MIGFDIKAKFAVFHWFFISHRRLEKEINLAPVFQKICNPPAQSIRS